ncbi:MAG: hypothetical protein ACO3YU_07860, partial [Candidatus Nanopelagicales bacterium]
EPSLMAFDGGYRIATAPPAVEFSIGVRPADAPDTSGPDRAEVDAAINDPASLVGPRLQAQAQRIATEFPEQARYMLVQGIKRTAEYQDVKYAG